MKPEPRVITEVCSLCGIDWKRHGKNPTAEGCVALLLDEVKSLTAQLAHRSILQPIAPWPYVTPWRPLPYTGPYWQTWTSGTTKPVGSASYNNLAPRALTVASGG